MKYKGKIILSFFLVAILVISTVSFATESSNKKSVKNTVENILESEEQNEVSEDILTTSQDIISQEKIEYYDGDLYEFKDKVDLTKTVNGNVYIMAKEINIKSSIIDGNVYLMAETVNIENSTINSSAYIMGKNISIDSNVKDAYILGDYVKLGEKSIVNRSLKVAGDKLDILGTVYDDIYSNTESVYVGDNAKILGSLNYSSSEKAVISPTATVNQENYTKTEDKVEKEKITSNVAQGIFKAVTVFSILGSLVKVAIISGVIILLLNGFIERNKNKQITDYLKDAGKGFCVLILTPIISIILCITIVGIGLGIVLMILYGILIYISSVLASIAIASCILKENNSKWKLYGLTILIYMGLILIKLIPVIGGVIGFLIMLVGLGLLIKKPKKQEINAEVVSENE